MAIDRGMRSDGIVSHPCSIVTPPLDEAELENQKAAARALAADLEARSTFDGRVSELEQLCKRLRREKPEDPKAQPEVPEFGSQAWYAAEILLSMKIVRTALAGGDAERAASEAVVVGALAAEAEARHHWPVVALGAKRLADVRRAGRARGQEIAARARREDQRTIELVSQYRSAPTIGHTLVGFLAERLDRNAQTIRRRLKRLGISPG